MEPNKRNEKTIIWDSCIRGAIETFMLRHNGKSPLTVKAYTGNDPLFSSDVDLVNGKPEWTRDYPDHKGMVRLVLENGTCSLENDFNIHYEEPLKTAAAAD